MRDDARAHDGAKRESVRQQHQPVPVAEAGRGRGTGRWLLMALLAVGVSGGSCGTNSSSRPDADLGGSRLDAGPDVVGLVDLHGSLDAVADAAELTAETESLDGTAGLDGEVANADPPDSSGDLAGAQGVRVPGEWEPQAATWMQWPTQWEASLRPDFSRVISVVQEYQPVHLLVLDKALEKNAREQIAAVGGDPDKVVYHQVGYDNSWMRDNGPVYALQGATSDSDNGTTLVLQDWGFDAWGGNFGMNIPFEMDDSVPAALATLLDAARVDYGNYILERGNLEANGAGTVVLGWDCQVDRNPGWTQEATGAMFAERLGAKQVLWVHGHDPEDLTTGHIDGVVRFVDEMTVAVARSLIQGDPTAAQLETAADMLAQAGFEVVRIDVPGTVSYKGVELPAMYMNWLVGNGFVAAMAFGNPAWDAAAQTTLEGLFPGRDVHMLEALELWYNGGGLHCITNDQPEP